MNTLKACSENDALVGAADSHIGAWVGHYLPVLVDIKWKQRN